MCVRRLGCTKLRKGFVLCTDVKGTNLKMIVNERQYFSFSSSFAKQPFGVVYVALQQEE